MTSFYIEKISVDPGFSQEYFLLHHYYYFLLSHTLLATHCDKYVDYVEEISQHDSEPKLNNRQINAMLTTKSKFIR